MDQNSSTVQDVDAAQNQTTAGAETEGEQTMTIKEIIKKPIQMFFFILVSVLACFVVPFVINMASLRQKYVQEMPVGYHFPQLGDIVEWFKAAAFLIVIEQFFRRVVWKLIVPICKEQEDLELQKARCVKSAGCLFKTLYFSYAIYWWYSEIKDTHFLHYLYGGKAASFDKGLEGFPYQDRSKYPQLMPYNSFTAGYHIQGLLTIVLQGRKKDFVEMGLHHFVTLFLYFGGHMLNIHELAAQFNFMHDLADLPLCFVKIWAETHYKNFTGICFVISMSVWFYTRCAALPIIIYETLTLCPDKVGWSPMMVWTFGTLMSTLCMLHWYWFFLSTKMLARFIKKGDTDDKIGGIQAKVKKL